MSVFTRLMLNIAKRPSPPMRFILSRKGYSLTSLLPKSFDAINVSSLDSINVPTLNRVATKTKPCLKPEANINASKYQSAISRAVTALISQQNPDGHWRYNIENFVYSPAEYILCMEYLGESGSATNVRLFPKLGNYIRKNQLPSGGWGIEPESTDIHVSISVMAYFALKIIGDQENEAYMIKARDAILRSGGLSHCNNLTRLHLALHGIISWSETIEMPVELMLLPTWFPIHVYKFSFARAIMVPIFVLSTLRKTVNSAVNLDELLTERQPAPKPKVNIKPIEKYSYQSRSWYAFFKITDRLLKSVRPFIPKRITDRALSEAVKFVTKRLNGLDGYGSICVPMQFSLMMFHALGYPSDNPYCVTQREALERLIVYDKDESAYISPFFSPVWDTSLTIHTLLETEEPRALDAVKKGVDWLLPLQVLNDKGDWAVTKPDLRPGGWAFYYRSKDYPDVDDTSVVLLALHRYTVTTKCVKQNEAIERGMEWLLGMQSKNGGWGAFDADNTAQYLDNIPLVENKVILDPPTADVSSRGLSTLTQVNSYATSQKRKCELSESIRNGIAFLLAEQERDGSWYGRWGVNYIYGTWSGLSALNSAGLAHEHESIMRGADWLLRIQNEDGGWGELCDSHKHDAGYVRTKSSADQTAWALLGLMAAGELEHPAVENGIRYLIDAQNSDGLWDDVRYTGVGIPNVVYYINHGYCKYFPLLALARYYRLTKNSMTKVEYGF